MKEPTLQSELDRLACAEVALVECKQNRDAARLNAGLALRREREARKISLRAMAKELGVSPVFVSDCERGNRWFAPDLLTQYRVVLEYGLPEADRLREGAI